MNLFIKRSTIGKLFCMLALTSPSWSAITIDNSTYRIGSSHDGNQHDLDDYAACAMVCALIGEAGLDAKFVHIDVNNHLGNSDPARATIMWNNVTGAVSRWNLNTVSVFDDQTNLTGARNSIAAQINASTANNRFYLACAGPMEVVWQGINASNPAVRQHCTAISHSPWNETHSDTSQMTHTWSSIQSSGVRTVKIAGQNQQGFNSSNAAFSWLRNSSNLNWQWLYARSVKSTWDASDAGMVYYIITGRGNDTPTVTDIQNLFNGNFVYSGSPGGPGGPGPGGSGGKTFEAEALSPTGVGCTPTTVADPSASGGAWVGANSTAVGNSFTFKTPTIAAGTYEIALSYKSRPNRGTYTLQVDGTPVGGTMDQYTSVTTYPLVTVGTVAFGSDGTHTLTMTVNGKNPASTGYGLTADAFTFTPKPTSPTLPPGGLHATVANGQVALSWSAVSGAINYKVKRATVSGGPYIIVASPTATNYSDMGLTNGATYYYVVSASTSVGESANSSEVSATAQTAGRTIEAETMAPSGAGCIPGPITDIHASGNCWVGSNSTAIGNSMTLTTPNINAGTYQLKLAYKAAPTRATYTVRVDGTQVGGTLSQYASAVSYPTVAVGTVTFTSPGTHTITLTVTGKNAASSGYTLTADAFLFTAP